MRTIALVLAILSGLPVAANAATLVRFEGGAVINSSSGTCSEDPTGSRYQVRYQPAGVGDNGSSSAFAFFQLTNAMTFELEGSGFVVGSYKTVKNYFIHYGTSVSALTVNVKFTGQSPTTVTTSTKFLSIVGIITNFDEMSGCAVKFSMALTQRTWN